MSSSTTEPVQADDRLKAVRRVIVLNRSRPDALVEVLHAVQGVYGHLPRELLRFVARQLKLPPSRVYGVATFYHSFSLKPLGKHHCTVCVGTACHVAGAAGVLAAVEAEGGTRAGATSADGAVSVQTARCLGVCGIAPAVVYDDTVVGHQTPEAARARVRGWRDGPR